MSSLRPIALFSSPGQFISRPSNEVCTHTSAKMDLKVKASERSQTHYDLELSPDF